MKRRPTLRETIAKNQASMDLYAAMSGKPRVVFEAPPEPVKRAPRAKPAEPRGTEADVMKAVHAFLRVHPRVAWFMRINSGAVSDGDRHVVFYRLWMRGLGVRSKGMADYLGQLDELEDDELEELEDDELEELEDDELEDDELEDDELED